jgi:glycosyltransferase involved in cell wall biosynthesis
VTDTRPLASVVVAVHRDQRMRRLLDSLARQTLPAHNCEVIVVENGSADLTDIKDSRANVRYAYLQAANSAAARNVGLRLARGRFLLMTDADCVARPDWAEKLTSALAVGAENGLAAVGGSIIKHQPTTWAQRHAITIVNGQQQLSYLPALHLPYVAGANAGYVTARLREAGGFDEDLKSGNDVDVCYKLSLRGYRIGLALDAVIEHEDRATLARHFRRFHRYAIYQVLLYAKYKHISRKRWVLDTYPLQRAAHAVAKIPQVGASLARGDSGPACRAVLQIVEAAGVLCGDLSGAVRFRQLYL